MWSTPESHGNVAFQQLTASSPLLSLCPSLVGFGVLVPPLCPWPLVLSLAKPAFPEIPARGEQELAVASPAVPVPPGCAAVGGRRWPACHCHPSSNPGHRAGMKTWLTGWCRALWMSEGRDFTQEPFPHEILQTQCPAGILQVSCPDPNTSHRLPVPSTGCKCLPEQHDRITSLLHLQPH